MPGQAAGKSRSEITSKLNALDISKQKKTGSGDDPVAHANTYGNPSLKHSGAIFGKTKKINIKGYC